LLLSSSSTLETLIEHNALLAVMSHFSIFCYFKISLQLAITAVIASSYFEFIMCRSGV
jgi:hypothetical protein